MTIRDKLPRVDELRRKFFAQRLTSEEKRELLALVRSMEPSDLTPLLARTVPFKEALVFLSLLDILSGLFEGEDEDE
jgi:hypothetical protein